MSDAPERIWIDDDRSIGGELTVFIDEPSCLDIDVYNDLYNTKYIRADRIDELEVKLADAATALKEIFDGKNWRLGQKFDPNSGNFDLSTQRKAYIKIKGEQP